MKPRPSPGSFQGIEIQLDPEAIASFDDAATAHAVCKDLNAHA